MFSDTDIHIMNKDEIEFKVRKLEGSKATNGSFQCFYIRVSRDESIAEVTLFVNNFMWEEFKTKLREALEHDDGTTEVVGAGHTEEGAGGSAQEGENTA